MSYGLICNCHICTKKTNCVDSTFVTAAISGIHAVNWANGIEKQLHLGRGNIEIKCDNFEEITNLSSVPPSK